MRSQSWRTLAIALAILCAVGCESVQKKFIRKGKTPERPSPVITFQDYTQSLTPMDRYQKHYAMFDYWNTLLMEELRSPTVNQKRLTHASSEALQELTTLRDLLKEGASATADQCVRERERINQQLQSGLYQVAQLSVMEHGLEMQTQHIHRELYWRSVQEQLQGSSKQTHEAAH